MSNVKVSVVLPNYNHARYLPQRIESILNQSYSDLEVILLDDCSPDNSREIIRKYAQQDERIQVVFNKKNSGNTFKQWNKGIALAKGEYIWIAESDDFAHPDLLRVLVSELESNEEVGLVYCDSVTVDEWNNELVELKHHYREYMNSDLWMQDFSAEGLDFIRNYMSTINVIPNASAILLRRSIIEIVGAANVETRLTGDWLYWISILSLCHISYIAKPYNFFRTHANNVRSKTASDGTILEESSLVLLKIKSILGDTIQNKAAAKNLLENWFKQFIYGNISINRNIRMFRNFNDLFKMTDKNITTEWIHFLFNHNMRGIKLILGDKYLYKWLKKR